MEPSMRASASSAVLASCTPAALQSATPSGTSGRKVSNPALCSCTASSESSPSGMSVKRSRVM